MHQHSTCVVNPRKYLIRTLFGWKNFRTPKLSICSSCGEFICELADTTLEVVVLGEHVHWTLQDRSNCTATLHDFESPKVFSIIKGAHSHHLLCFLSNFKEKLSRNISDRNCPWLKIFLSDCNTYYIYWDVRMYSVTIFFLIIQNGKTKSAAYKFIVLSIEWWQTQVTNICGDYSVITILMKFKMIIFHFL